MTCALLGLMRVVTAGWAYRGRRGEGLECAIICGVAIVGQIGWVEVWEWIWLGGGRVCLGVGQCRIGLVEVELEREWSWV